MRLYDHAHRRLYINAEERRRFMHAALACELQIASLCLTLLYSGCRISEALELTASAVQLEARILTFRTLKRRNSQVYREVPIPPDLAELIGRAHDLSASCLYRPLWGSQGHPLNRATAYRWVKSVMRRAGIQGKQACPKGLRHGYGIHALSSGVQLNMLQKWMGHASMSTTAIYANAVGAEEMAIADRMW